MVIEGIAVPQIFLGDETSVIVVKGISVVDKISDFDDFRENFYPLQCDRLLKTSRRILSNGHVHWENSYYHASTFPTH